MKYYLSSALIELAHNVHAETSNYCFNAQDFFLERRMNKGQETMDDKDESCSTSPPRRKPG